jgi:type I restriction enzyme M protein
MSSNQSGEGDIRRALIEADLVDCMVALPGQLFYSTPIPVCLWFITKSKGARTLLSASGEKQFIRARKRQTLFIDARKMGRLIDRVHRELTDEDLEKITSTYQSWRHNEELRAKEGQKAGRIYECLEYTDIPGFCKAANTDDIAAHDYVLTPGRYVGAVEIEDDGDPFEEKMPRLVAELHAQFEESEKLEKTIRANLRGLGYGG